MKGLDKEIWRSFDKLFYTLTESMIHLSGFLDEPFILLKSPNGKIKCFPLLQGRRIHRKQGWNYIYDIEPKLTRWQGLKRFFTG